jgi:serine/threonine protein kinase
VRLVLELCDRGNLKEHLMAGGCPAPPAAQQDMRAILATAIDVACAMVHLHTENIVHSDLKVRPGDRGSTVLVCPLPAERPCWHNCARKPQRCGCRSRAPAPRLLLQARNVLLKSSGTDPRGFVAKVSDFGLSVQINPTQTHVSNIYQGTLTHSACGRGGSRLRRGCLCWHASVACRLCAWVRLLSAPTNQPTASSLRCTPLAVRQHTRSGARGAAAWQAVPGVRRVRLWHPA